MKPILLILGILLLFGVSAIRGTDSLECYSCSDAQSFNECESVETCETGQVCFKKREYENQVQFTMGCIDKESCGRHDSRQNSTAKMNADKTSYCCECCSRDKCNEHLCFHLPHSLCQDDKSVDCAKLDSMFDICEVSSQAKKICPRYCNLCHLVDGNWSPWSPWTSCDVTCGSGLLLRHRTCTNPAPQNGGLDCPGNGTEQQTCHLKLCRVHGGWALWGIWGICSVTCGEGMRKRTRSCTNPRPERFGDHCFGDSTEDELCNTRSCAVDGGWSEWSQWGICSATCGNVGLQNRIRSCTNPTPRNAGQHCIGQNLDVQLCHGLCTDCYEYNKLMSKKKSGVYNVHPLKTSRAIPVYCDFDTDSGGWTVFQFRFNGSVDFYRNFTKYERGFGSLDGEFWLGLKHIYEMVSRHKTELKLDLTAANGRVMHGTFKNFRLSNGPYYTLRMNIGVSTPDESEGLPNHVGQAFTTYDHDQDAYSKNCAVLRDGGWWYKNCGYTNLNGNYAKPGILSVGKFAHDGMFYHSFTNNFESLKTSKMMFRRV
ncbi:uncharacterized protein LOC132712741 [Ruditapes philippinarum]|uniref:uncharacterized protein LOC132712741 n=1 Tax=Ruditapes philippinarum TaxID=129788 RepID=UPI00295A8701|nr:uncharacterized protein LOC132712741 [Ruditapes philippinarum]